MFNTIPSGIPVSENYIGGISPITGLAICFSAVIVLMVIWYLFCDNGEDT